MREQSVQSKCLRYLDSIGAYTVKVISATRSGVPDTIICLKGKFIAFEFKSEYGKPTPLQELNIKKIREAGGKAYLVRSLDELKLIIHIEVHNDN